MNFTRIYNSSLRWRGLTTSLFLTLTSRGELMAPWAIRSNENLPTHTCTWTLDHLNVLPTYKLFFEPWCTEPGFCMIRKASIMSWISTRSHFRENNYSIKQRRRVLNPVVSSSKPKDKPISVALIPHIQTTYGRFSRMLANTSNVLAHSRGRSPGSFVLWRTTWEWGLRGYTAYPVSVARCTSDRLVDHWSPNKGEPPTHTAWTSKQIGCGGTQFETGSSHKIPRHPDPLYCTWLYKPTYQRGHWVGAPP